MRLASPVAGNNNDNSHAHNPYGDSQSREGTRGSSRGGGRNKSRGSNNSRADTGTFVTGIDADEDEEEEEVRRREERSDELIINCLAGIYQFTSSVSFNVDTAFVASRF